MKQLAKTMSHALAAIGLAGTALLPAIASAAAPTIKIETADLNLATPKGQKTLENRIERAARAVCRATQPNTGTRIMSQEATACLTAARAQAREQVAAIMADQQRGG